MTKINESYLFMLQNILIKKDAILYFSHFRHFLILVICNFTVNTPQKN